MLKIIRTQSTLQCITCVGTHFGIIVCKRQEKGEGGERADWKGGNRGSMIEFIVNRGHYMPVDADKIVGNGGRCFHESGAHMHHYSNRHVTLRVSCSIDKSHCTTK